jgi:hypothetical protein
MVITLLERCTSSTDKFLDEIRFSLLILRNRLLYFYLLIPLALVLQPCTCKKFIPQQAEVAQRVPGILRPRIFLTFGTARVVGRQTYAPAAFTPGEIPGTHFQRLSRPQGTWFRRGEPRKKIPSDTSGNRSRGRPCTFRYCNIDKRSSHIQS